MNWSEPGSWNRLPRKARTPGTAWSGPAEVGGSPAGTSLTRERGSQSRTRGVAYTGSGMVVQGGS